MKASILFPAILFSVAAPAFAGGESERFEHDGITYVYDVDERDDHRVLSGRQYPSGARFRLVVRDGRVSGRVGGTMVYFRLSEIDDARAREIELASN